MRKALTSGALAAVAVLAAGVAAACGGEATPSAQPTSFAECLQQQGIDSSALGNFGGGAGRPSGFPRPDGSGRPNGLPSGLPTARPDASAGPGGGNFPGGGFGNGNQAPAGVDQAKWQSAMEACSSLRPTGMPGQPGGGGGNTGAEAAYRNCLSNRGVTLTPDLASTEPAVAEALAACAPLKPAQ